MNNDKQTLVVEDSENLLHLVIPETPAIIEESGACEDSGCPCPP